MSRRVDSRIIGIVHPICYRNDVDDECISAGVA
ncbi:MAG: hypothetical protein A4E74_00723 [Syntrophus sp. PtaB.Bin075]|nr:MAG: hypothetical protein A4E74_00723 [Syntrophus sp. PtaB.Bin075]